DAPDPGPGAAVRVREIERQVEPGLPADGGQQRVGALVLDDARQYLDGERLDVRPVGELRISHDRRRVRVREDDAVALLLQRLAGLRPRVVELARLPDDDGGRAAQQERAEGARRR